MSIRKKLAHNTLYNALGRMWEGVASLLLVAYAVRRVGHDDWAVWALVSVFTGYVALADFGIRSAYARYIAEHAARDERDEISAVVCTGFFFYAVFGALLAAVGWPLTGIGIDAAITWGYAAAERRDELVFLYRGSLLLFAASGLAAPFTAIQTGLQRMGITNLLGFVSSLVKLAATVWFIERGHGLAGLLYASILSFLVFGFGSAGAAFGLAPYLRVSPARITRATFNRLFGFGWRTQVSRLCNLVMFDTDKALVGIFTASPTLVTSYDVGVRLANMMRQIPVMLLTALTPAAAELDARDEHERLCNLYLRSTKYVAAVTALLVALTVGLAGPLMRLWMGEGFERSAWILRLIAFGYLANIVPGAGISVVLGQGRADIQMKAGLVSMFSNIALTIALYFSIGFWGVPLATVASMFLSWAWFLRALTPALGVRPVETLRGCVWPPCLAAAPVLFLCSGGDIWASHVGGIWSNLAVVALGAALGAGLYAAGLRRLAFLDRFDAELLMSLGGTRRLPGLRWFLRTAWEAQR